ncbi:hypothetical protein Syun_003257 [Stephania yunnanensis]|uniref:Uncharacterized protein n=1 Tax=Stephania yunnanensis TaxID=152371 RepID=A0AAP0Q0G5_9MAGN
MALTLSASSSSSRSSFNRLSFSNSLKTLTPISISIPIRCKPRSCGGGASRIGACRAAGAGAAAGKQQSSSAKKRGKKRGPVKRVEVEVEEGEREVGDGVGAAQFRGVSPLPKPPAGFVVDSMGRVLLASSRRIVTIVDSLNNLPLECVIRRIVTSSSGNECMLLCPVDTPVQILKSTNNEGWSAVDDDEVESLLPAASYALAKIHMHLVVSGLALFGLILGSGSSGSSFYFSFFVLSDFATQHGVDFVTQKKTSLNSAQNPFSFTGLSLDLLTHAVLNEQVDDGQDVDGLPTEVVEITCFNQDGAHYMIYTPSDPLLFVAAKDENGHLQIADDDLLNDPAIVEAIDEETEFNALVEEEAALLESLLGKR